MNSAVFRLLAIAPLVATLAGCTRPPSDPMILEGNLMTVENRTPRNWEHVEIWLNTYYRVTTAGIPAGGRFQAPLDTFVAGFGQRFDVRRAQIKELRLTAVEPGGRSVELKKEFAVAGLGALKDFGGKKP